MTESIPSIIFFAALIYTIYFMSKVKKNTASDIELSGKEKAQVIITEILNPVVAGAIYYYGWKKVLPKKAKQANKYSFIIVGVIILISIILSVV